MCVAWNQMPPIGSEVELDPLIRGHWTLQNEQNLAEIPIQNEGVWEKIVRLGIKVRKIVLVKALSGLTDEIPVNIFWKSSINIIPWHIFEYAAF